MVISLNKNGLGKGSGRSNSYHHLGKAISQLAKENLILKGGGHAKAAGVTLETKNINEAMERLSHILSDQNRKKNEISELNINSIISINAITLNLIEQIEKAGPFGPDAPAPIFVIKNCKIKWCKLLGNKHLKFHIYDESYKNIKSIFFRALDSKAGIYLYENLEAQFHFAGNIEISDWLGNREPNFIVRDVALAK